MTHPRPRVAGLPSAALPASGDRDGHRRRPRRLAGQMRTAVGNAGGRRSPAGDQRGHAARRAVPAAGTDDAAAHRAAASAYPHLNVRPGGTRRNVTGHPGRRRPGRPCPPARPRRDRERHHRQFAAELARRALQHGRAADLTFPAIVKLRPA